MYSVGTRNCKYNNAVHQARPARPPARPPIAAGPVRPGARISSHEFLNITDSCIHVHWTSAREAGWACCVSGKGTLRASFLSRSLSISLSLSVPLSLSVSFLSEAGASLSGLSASSSSSSPGEFSARLACSWENFRR